MLLDDGVLYEQLMKLASRTGKPVHWKVSVEILAGGKVVEVNTVLNFNRVSNYLTNKTELLHATVRVFQTEYLNRILPNRRQLTARVILRLTNEKGDLIAGTAQYTQLFRAFLMESVNPSIISQAKESTGGNNYDDLARFRELDLELVDFQYFYYRNIETFGVFRSCNVKSLIRGLMTDKTPKTDEGREMVYVDFPEEPHNQKQYEQMVVEGSVPLEDIPSYVQGKYGVFNTGLGYFYYKGTWYIYPLMDITRYDRSERKLTVILVPKNEMMGLSVTYNDENPKDVIVFTSGDIHYEDNSEDVVNNLGNGFRYSTGLTYPDLIRQHTAGSSHIPKDRNRRAVLVEKRLGGTNRLKTTEDNIHVNPYKESSAIASGLLAHLRVTWENSNPNLLYPGMPVKVLYKESGAVHSLRGILSASVVTYAAGSNRPDENRYVCSTTLTFSITKNT